MSGHHAFTLPFQLRRWWNACLNMLYPDDQRACLLCHRPMQTLPAGPSEEKIPESIGVHTAIRGVCPFCLQDTMGLSKGMRTRKLMVHNNPLPVITAAAYEGLVRNAIRQWKYDGAVELTPWFATWALGAYQTFMEKYPPTRWPVSRLDVIVPVPTSGDRLRKRGYDHVDLLAQQLSLDVSLPIWRALSRHTKGADGFTQSQTAKTASERRRSLVGAYHLNGDHSVEGTHILLLDDVVTTGATLHTCANTLLSGGAATVLCLAISDVQ